MISRLVTRLATKKYLLKGFQMEDRMTDLQYKDMLRRQIREYKRIIELGVSAEAELEIRKEIEDMEKTLEG